MSNSELRFHLVDGKVSAKFSHLLTGPQFAHLYKFVRSSVTKRACGEEILRSAANWGLRVELTPTPVELGIEVGISPPVHPVAADALTHPPSLPFRVHRPESPTPEFSEQRKTLPPSSWLDSLAPASLRSIGVPPTKVGGDAVQDCTDPLVPI